jgi:ATP-dependent Clp protease protease subunit
VVNHSNQTFEKVEADFDRDYWMTASEAKEYGLVDEVLLTNPRKEKKEK